MTCLEFDRTARRGVVNLTNAELNGLLRHMEQCQPCGKQVLEALARVAKGDPQQLLRSFAIGTTLGMRLKAARKLDPELGD